MRKLAVLAFSVFAGVALAEDDDIESRTEAADKLSAQFLGELKSALVEEMQQGGPAAAIGVCTDLAPEIAGRLSRETGWRVTRVGTRVRNPLLGMPDPWEQQALQKLQQELDSGAQPPLSHSEIVEEPGGRYFRYVRAINVGGPCLACHGSKDQMSSEVRHLLAERYPHDQATGYALGDLRGAVSIKQPLAMKPQPTAE
ncbi:MAG: DUF3365 domain-containing protein [Ectothiorhodospiraceae bacterium]|jgi:hypothetical protein